MYDLFEGLLILRGGNGLLRVEAGPLLMGLDQDDHVGGVVKCFVGLRDRAPVLRKREGCIVRLRLGVELILPSILLRVLDQLLEVVGICKLSQFLERRRHKEIVQVKETSRVLWVEDVMGVELISQNSQEP